MALFINLRQLLLPLPHWQEGKGKSDALFGSVIGENILVGKLISEVPKYADAISPQAVIESGALNLQALTSSTAVLYGLRQAYGVAISAIMICATVSICFSMLATLGMQRLNLKIISRERGVNKQTTRSAASSSGIVVYKEDPDNLAMADLGPQKFEALP